MAQIDIEKLNKIITKADEIFITAEGEQVLIDLLAIEQQVQDAIAQAKLKLEQAALKANPNFSSIQANRIKVYYRAYGSKYYVDEANINLAPKEFYDVESKVTYKIKTKELEKSIEETGKVPAGIIEVERKKTLTFTLKKGKETENE
jgi:hypothetical protein